MSGKKKSQELCTMLYWELRQKKLPNSDITELIKNTLEILTKGGMFTLPGINKTLSDLGWPEDIISEKAMKHLCGIITIEFDYSVKEHNVA